MNWKERVQQWVVEPTLRRLGVPVLRQYGFEPTDPPRVLLYTASNVGLGHLFRVLRTAAELRRLLPRVNLLLLTDTEHLHVTQYYGQLAVLRLPNFHYFGENFREKPVGLELSKGKLRLLRYNAMLAAVHSFQPHVFLMDTAPHGKRNELYPVLEYLAAQRRPPIRILQLRDVPFVPGEAERTDDARRQLTRNPDFYDYLFVAGDPQYFDLAKVYDWPKKITRKLFYLGFIIPEADGDGPPAVESGTEREIERMMQRPARRIVASFGGGWEAEELGGALLAAYAELAAQRGEPLQFYLFTGPSAEDAALAGLQARAAGRDDVLIRKFSPRFSHLLARCDLAVLQAGSTPFQILETDIPMLLYARDFKSKEQQFRAEQMIRFANVELLGEDGGQPAVLRAAMARLLDAPRVPRRTGFRYGGVRRSARAIAAMLADSRKPRRLSVEELNRICREE
ncbi:MAG: hypothetical protein BWZ08_00802 [candidate division BRC1 bacterium ADurb.BinA292]|nr:MAG: hypothetical protein BWZ08_00802 [candidate division BRC1 bacterium ADurb.BinA292]